MAPTTLVLLGRTGNGKSSTGNSILGRNAFKSVWSSKSVTKECKMDSRTWKDGRVLNVIDTPGLFDTNVPKEIIDKEIVKCINLAKDGVHGVLFVLSLKNRFTNEEAEAMETLEMLFGPSIVNYMVLVFTGGDQLDDDGPTFQNYIEGVPTNLKRIMKRCDSRTVVFNNHKSASPTVKENQITQLLEHVDRIAAEFGNQPYSNELFAKAQLMTSQLFHIKDKEKLFSEQIKFLNETMEQNNRALQERLKSERDSWITAENDSALVRRNLEAKIRELQKKLEVQKKKKDEGCTIL